MKEAKQKQWLDSADYRRFKTFDVIIFSGYEKLIAPVKWDGIVLYYLWTSDLYDELHNTDLNTEHAGRTKMEKGLTRKYKNITKHTITLYINLRKQCQAKESITSKSLITKPVVFKELISRCQVDLIDMQCNSDGDYRFILNYQGYLTKFVFLRPLEIRRAEDVAHTLLDIFTTIGAPSILR